MTPEKVAVSFEPGLFAVIYRYESRVAAEVDREPPARARERGRGRAFDADQYEPGDDPIAQLVDEDLLLGCGRPRQESGHVGRDVGARDHHGAERDAGEPRAHV